MSEKVERYMNWEGFEKDAIDETTLAFDLWKIADRLYGRKKFEWALGIYKMAKEEYEKLIDRKGEDYPTLTPNPQPGIEILTLSEAVEYLSKRIEELERAIRG